LFPGRLKAAPYARRGRR